MSQSISRTEAREAAMRVVFSGVFTDETLDLALDGKTAAAPELTFINKILSAVKENRPEIDDKIAKNLHGWSLERLSKTDLAVLRVASAEKLTCGTAKPVIINECVAIAKKYGTQSDGSFINGILAKIME